MISSSATYKINKTKSTFPNIFLLKSLPTKNVNLNCCIWRNSERDPWDLAHDLFMTWPALFVSGIPYETL
jgi:hypothetical protein